MYVTLVGSLGRIMMQVPLLQCRWDLVGGLIGGLRLVLIDGYFKLGLNN